MFAVGEFQPFLAGRRRATAKYRQILSRCGPCGVREPVIQRAYLMPSSRIAQPLEAEARHVLADILGRGPTSPGWRHYQSDRVDNSQLVIYGVRRHETPPLPMWRGADRVLSRASRQVVSVSHCLS
jgi:hypothetical protein